jgi:hypothetical protein
VTVEVVWQVEVASEEMEQDEVVEVVRQVDLEEAGQEPEAEVV